MSATLELLGRQHQDVLAQLAAVETQLRSPDASADLAGFGRYLGHEVGKHFDVEEQALFPVLARHLSLTQGPLAVMNAEHVEFRRLLDALGTAVGHGELDQQRQHASDLIALLRAHIAKEDQVLFPMASRLLSADEQKEVDTRAAALDASGSPESA